MDEVDQKHVVEFLVTSFFLLLFNFSANEPNMFALTTGYLFTGHQEGMLKVKF